MPEAPEVQNVLQYLEEELKAARSSASKSRIRNWPPICRSNSLKAGWPVSAFAAFTGWASISSLNSTIWIWSAICAWKASFRFIRRQKTSMTSTKGG
nr:hypothetical protein [Allobaculum sp. Allo2]